MYYAYKALLKERAFPPMLSFASFAHFRQKIAMRERVCQRVSETLMYYTYKLLLCEQRSRRDYMCPVHPLSCAYMG